MLPAGRGRAQCRDRRGCRQRVCRVLCTLRSPKRKYANSGSTSTTQPQIISVDAPFRASDAWRLQPVIDLLLQGAVGILPTDTLPAIVCDLESRQAVTRLYGTKDLDPKKPLSILCSSFTQVSHYTTGLPASNVPGQPNWFAVVKRILPGPYTLILPASKQMPSQVVDYARGKTMHRKSVGIRIPDDGICQAVLQGLGRPLLCTSVHVPAHLSEDTEVPDLGTMLDMYGARGVDFIVDVGPRVATRSTVVDMTGGLGPVVVREGKGDSSMFPSREDDASEN